MSNAYSRHDLGWGKCVSAGPWACCLVPLPNVYWLQGDRWASSSYICSVAVVLGSWAVRGSGALGFGASLWPEACVELAWLWVQVCAPSLGIPCFCWARSVVCTWLVNTCMPYFGKFLSLFLPGDYLACVYPPSFTYGSCCLAVTGIKVALNF